MPKRQHLNAAQDHTCIVVKAFYAKLCKIFTFAVVKVVKTIDSDFLFALNHIMELLA